MKGSQSEEGDKENVSKEVNVSKSKSKFSQENDCNKTQIITTKPLLKLDVVKSQSKSKKKRSFDEIVGSPSKKNTSVVLLVPRKS